MPRGKYTNKINGSGIKESILSILKTTTDSIATPPDFPNETHLQETINGKKVRHNYTGPHTALSERTALPKGHALRRPVNRLDSASKGHDIAYNKTNKAFKEGKITKEVAMDDIHEADQEFIDKLKKIPGLSSTAASTAIKLKRVSEKLGLLSDNVFSLPQDGNGHCCPFELGKMMLTKYQTPDHRLRKEMKGKGQSGGIAPFLVPIISGLAIEGISALVKHFITKQSGEGIQNKTIEQKKKFVIDKLDDMNPNEQIKIISSVLSKIK